MQKKINGSRTANVNWAPAHAGGWDEWKDTDQDVQNQIAITRYNLYKYGQGLTFYNYMLQITNTENWNFIFYDGTGDGYHLSTWRNGNHYLRFNSDKPTIEFIVAK